MEIIKSYDSIDEYIKEKNKEKIENIYNNAVDTAIEKSVTDELIAKAIRDLSDAEAELSIGERWIGCLV